LIGDGGGVDKVVVHEFAAESSLPDSDLDPSLFFQDLGILFTIVIAPLVGLPSCLDRFVENVGVLIDKRVDGQYIALGARHVDAVDQLARAKLLLCGCEEWVPDHPRIDAAPLEGGARL